MDTIAQVQARRTNNLRDKIADLEAANIAQARTIEQQAVIIREHQAADVIAVEAIRAQAEEITRLRAVIETTERCVKP